MSWLLVGWAFAGAGPWVPGEGQLHLYAGLDVQRFTRLNAEGLDGAVRIGEGVSTVGGVLDLSYGLGSGLEAELILPVQHAYVHRPDTGPCVDFGDDVCAPTTTIGVIDIRLKGVLLDEFHGAPLSLAIGGVMRIGAFTFDTRHRFTNAGEGTTDVGARLSVGRSIAVGGGHAVFSGDVQALYRFPNVERFPLPDGGLAIPGPEAAASGDLLFAPGASFAFGPAVQWARRLTGLDVAEMLGTAATDPDRFASLHYGVVRTGGKLILQNDSYDAISIAVLRTVYARNNPSDTWSFGVGVSLNNLVRKER